MRTFRIAILLAIALFTASIASAASYYVAKTGSDTNTGTLASPWLTIDHGVDQLAAGDTLYIRTGTYNEHITIWNRYGTSAAPIYIKEYTGESVIIDGTGINETALVAIGGNSSYVRFDGFEVQNAVGHGIYIRDAHNIKIRDNRVHDCGDSGITARTASASTFGTVHDIVISGNTVYHCVKNNSARTATGGWQQAISAYRADRVEITGNYVYENYGEGIDYIVSDNGTIVGNRVWDNFSTNIYLDNAQSTRVEGNRCSCSNPAYYRDGVAGGGISTANETYTEQNPLNDIKILNNVVIRCKYGFNYRNSEHGGGLHNTVIANNVFYSTDYATIWIKDADNGTNVHSTTLVANNIFYQKYNRPYASSATVGITYQNNVWYGGGDASTIITGAGDLTSDPKLVNPGGSTADDYKLQSTSPAINAGTSVSAVTIDYFGTTRAGRGTALDIGIHEY